MKTKTMHTPGPWTSNNGSVFAVDPLYKIKREAKMVCGGPIGYNSTKFTIQEIDSNARLIAAAPDLLAMVKRALRDEENRCRVNDLDVDNNVNVLNYRAAIAKASGESK